MCRSCGQRRSQGMLESCPMDGEKSLARSCSQLEWSTPPVAPLSRVWLLRGDSHCPKVGQLSGRGRAAAPDEAWRWTWHSGEQAHRPCSCRAWVPVWLRPLEARLTPFS